MRDLARRRARHVRTTRSATWAIACGALFALGQSEAAEPADPTPESIVGIWRAPEENGSIGEMVFNADGTADIFANGKSMQRDLIRGRGELRYRFDPAPRPAHLDIIARTLDGREQVMVAIVEFPRADHMRISSPVAGPRPTEFSPEASVIVVRVDPASPSIPAPSALPSGPRVAPAASSTLIPFTLPSPLPAGRAPTADDVRAHYPVLQSEGQAMAALRYRAARLHAQLHFMNEAPFTSLLKRLLADVSANADPARPAAQQQAADDRLAKKQIRPAYEALAAYVKRINPDLERANNELEYVRLRLRTQEKAQRLQRLAVGAGGKVPLAESIATLEQGIARSESSPETFSLASTAEVEGLMQLYDTAYENIQRDMLSAAMKQPIERIPAIRRNPACPPPTETATTKPAGPGSITTAPRIDIRRSKPTDAFYPLESRRAFSEGVVTLRAFVDASGCVEQVQVLGATGDERLDAAAVRWALDGATFTPGLRDGVGLAMPTMFRVRFALRE